MTNIAKTWSPYNRRFCINVVPCVTVWVTLPGGNVPDKATKFPRLAKLETS